MKKNVNFFSCAPDLSHSNYIQYIILVLHNPFIYSVDLYHLTDIYLPRGGVNMQR